MHISNSSNNNLILDGHKLNWHADRVESWLRGEKIAPITIDWALTQKCNYNCVYCYSQLQKNDPSPLKKDQIYSFLDDAAEIGVKAISFVSDGESTCSPFLYDAVERAYSNGLDVALGTNGILLRKDKLYDLLSKLTYIRFNISAGTAERYAEIHGCAKENFYEVCSIIKETVKIKKEKALDVTIGLQMVLMPSFADQIIPLTELGGKLGVDYLVIKHCSDDENGSLNIDYSGYNTLFPILEKAESYTSSNYLVKAKWSKLLSGNKRIYSQCYGSQFLLQVSGSGIVAACGSFFNPKYSKYHIGDLRLQSFKSIWESQRYTDVMNLVASGKFNTNIHCGTLCLQHKVNEFLWQLKNGEILLIPSDSPEPCHLNFI